MADLVQGVFLAYHGRRAGMASVRRIRVISGDAVLGSATNAVLETGGHRVGSVPNGEHILVQTELGKGSRLSLSFQERGESNRQLCATV